MGLRIILVILALWSFFAYGGRVAPNFVYILTDDQDLLLNSLMPMKKTLRLIADKGKFFQNAFVNTPICCPSRSTILTGKYAHNTGVVNNSISGNCGGESWRKTHEPDSLAAVLKRAANYSTFYAGKYLNQYGSKLAAGLSHVPPGYDWWIGLKGNSKYYNYTLSLNGTSKTYRNVYLTDLLADFSLDFLNQNSVTAGPFFMMVAPPASHAPFLPPKRYLNKFPKMTAVRNPSFNYTPNGKHWVVSMPPERLPADVSALDQIHRRRLQTLLAVDDLIERIILKLKELKIFQRTYVILNSDNGFHIGQFGQPWDKRQPYETDVRVPFIISGPGIPKKTLESYPVSSVDVAPTILDLAGVHPPPSMDGRSFKKRLFKNWKQRGSRFGFVEYWGEGDAKTVEPACQGRGGPLDDGSVAECDVAQWCKCQDSRNNTYSCVVDFTYRGTTKFCRFADDSNFIEVYDLTHDPYELRNAYLETDRKVVNYYAAILNKFQRCAGKTCRTL
ncbi:N-acetylglucosamine-6-sulfatase-like [Cylas formicarius]|uniref:N-acetylglucosamine-6-sulfatase-like n=1 Tax=Cylas formicarius TaxID=197179 RepID=UPI0029587DE6|nr:N-acetylglucosamine-6-sulfatase-like [Cylas formicarius]